MNEISENFNTAIRLFNSYVYSLKLAKLTNVNRLKVEYELTLNGLFE